VFPSPFHRPGPEILFAPAPGASSSGPTERERAVPGPNHDSRLRQRETLSGRLSSAENARSAMDTLVESIRHFLSELRGRLLRTLAEQEAGRFRVARALHKLRGGQVDAALRQLPDGPQPGPALVLARARTLGYPISDSLLRARVRPEELGPGADPRRLLAAGLYRIEQGRSEAVDEILTWLRRAGSRPGAPRDGESQAAEAVRRLKGYRAHAAGRLRTAERHWAERETVPPHAVHLVGGPLPTAREARKSRGLVPGGVAPPSSTSGSAGSTSRWAPPTRLRRRTAGSSRRGRMRTRSFSPAWRRPGSGFGHWNERPPPNEGPGLRLQAVPAPVAERAESAGRRPLVGVDGGRAYPDG
jgi:hypothetical protein